MSVRQSSVASALGLLGLVVLLVFRVGRPPAPVGADAPALEFSAERAFRHVRAIAERPHPPGSADHARVRAYLTTELTALGLAPQIQEATGIGTRYQTAGRIYNVLARVPGTTSGPAVLLMAHYDGVEAAPAAGDDGAGSAVLLETLRAITAGPPLTHDVIALFSDGEESGLLGAAAFVREHQWAKDVEAILNFEARGTSGRAFMFETGPGNLDAVRLLRGAPSVVATSLSVSVYRLLPNDTDLSELAPLERPALNFAFADGVERYHTDQDDVAHLDPGSVQHLGMESVAMVRAFATGPLPRPKTGDAVFFDLPAVGLIVYPESWAKPLAVVALLLAIGAAVTVRRHDRRWVRGLVAGLLAVIVTVALSGAVAFGVTRGLTKLHATVGGFPGFRGIYAAALALLGFGIGAAGWGLLSRWLTTRSMQLAGVFGWAILGAVVSWKLPGASFVFVWPALAAALAAIAGFGPAKGVALWIATALTLAIHVPLLYSLTVIMLGVTSPGGIVLAVFVTLLVWLLPPLLDALAGGRRWSLGVVGLAGGLVLLVVGGLTVRTNPAHPDRSTLIYALDGDSPAAWLAAQKSMPRGDLWSRQALGAPAMTIEPVDSAAPGAQSESAWLTTALSWPATMLAVEAPRVERPLPVVTTLSDSTTDQGRRIVARIQSGPETLVLTLRVPNAKVSAAEIDGRVVDTLRYRRRSADWTMSYAGPPDSGVVIALTLPPGATPRLEILARSAGIPPLPGHPIPPRPADVMQSQTGDVTVIRRVLTW